MIILRYKACLLMFAAALVMWGCLEYNIFTKVSKDGSIDRKVTVKGDSADIFRGSFPVPSGSSWHISSHWEESDSNSGLGGRKIFVYEASSRFSNVDELNGLFCSDTAFSDHVSVCTELIIRKRVFSKYYDYKEVYHQLFPFHYVPISQFLTQDELKIHLAEREKLYYSSESDSVFVAEDSLELPAQTVHDSLQVKIYCDSLERKFEAWQIRNIYEGFFEVVTRAIINLNRTAPSDSIRLAFFDKLDRREVLERDGDMDDILIREAAAFFGLDEEEIRLANRNGFNLLNRKLKVATFALESYTNQVILPGKVVKTNADKKNQNEVTWKFRVEDYYAADYTMEVQSRTLLAGRIGFSAALLLMISAGTVLFFRRRK
jgi:hypothetical protein